MQVSVEYFDGELQEDLQLKNEQWGILPKLSQIAPSRKGPAAHRLVKEAERNAAQKELDRVKLGEEELEKNVLHFKYLGVMYSGDGDSLVVVNHREAIARSRYAVPKQTLTPSRMPKASACAS